MHPTSDNDGNFPHVYAWQLTLLEKYGHLLTNTGGNDPADLLNDLQRPGTDERPNRLMSSNIVRFTLAVGVASQVSLLSALEKGGLL